MTSLLRSILLVDNSVVVTPSFSRMIATANLPSSLLLVMIATSSNGDHTAPTSVDWNGRTLAIQQRRSNSYSGSLIATLENPGLGSAALTFSGQTMSTYFACVIQLGNTFRSAPITDKDGGSVLPVTLTLDSVIGNLLFDCNYNQAPMGAGQIMVGTTTVFSYKEAIGPSTVMSRSTSVNPAELTAISIRGSAPGGDDMSDSEEATG